MLKKFEYLNTNVFVYEQEEDEKPRLLQHEKLFPLSLIRDDNGKLPKAIINCSYFTPKYALGRNQGDLRNDTVDSEFCDLVFTNDGKYHCGRYKSWDYQNNVVAGMSLATWLIKEGKDVEEISEFANGKLTTRRPQTAIGILNDGKILLIVSEGDNGIRGLNGYELRTLIRSEYPNIEFLGQCDGGGSTEMIVNSKIVNRLSEGRERAMWNGFALVKTEEKPIEPKEPQKAILKFKDYTGKEMMSGITQGEHEGNHIYQFANDFNGRGGYDRVDILAPFDCIVKGFNAYDNTAFFESTCPVEFADGTIHEHAWFLIAHTMDSDVKALNLAIGKEFKQGEPCYTEGNKGIGSGFHMHMEQGVGQYNGKNGMPYYKTDKFITVGNQKWSLYLPCSTEEGCAIASMMYLDAKADYSNADTAMKRYEWKFYNEEKPKCECEELKKQVVGLTQQLVAATKTIERLEKENMILSDKIKQITKILNQ